MTADKPHVGHALGIDFGTSNSYFSDVKVGGLELSYTDLKFHNGHSSVPTCVLYEKKPNPHAIGDEPRFLWTPHSFGEAAIELWKDLLDDERPHFRFRGGFKPDIAFEEQAYEDAVSFFRCAKDYLIDHKLLTHFTPAAGRQVIVGVPARNVTGQETRTLRALEEAGLYDVVLIPEPEGALFYHLYYDSERITVEKAHQGVLVVDFGGGTFDVAFLKDGVVQQHWGNPMLGGRLFDDLFYQWFLDMHGKEERRREMLRDGTLEYLRTFGFRRLKERFSNAWSNGQLTRFRERLTVGADFDYGVFRGATLDEFMSRATHYKASQDLLLDLELLQDKSADWLREGPIDLLEHIREQVSATVLATQGFDHNLMTAAVLTGGSCRWPFMQELVQEAFPQAECLQSPDPEATISRGLALCFAFREYSKEVSQNLTSNQEELYKQILQTIKEAYRTFASRVSERFTSELYSGQIQPIFESWREEGGTISELEGLTSHAATEYFAGPGQIVIDRERVYLQERIEQRVNDLLFAWLRQHRVTRIEYLSLDHLQDMHNNEELAIHSQLGDILDGFFDAIRYILAGVVSMILASLAGGTGVALLMTGPVGWLIGLVVGAAATLTVLKNVDTKHIKIPPFVLKMSASNERLSKAQGTFQTDMEQALLDMFTEKEKELQTTLYSSIDEVVTRLAQAIPVTAVMQKNTTNHDDTSPT